MNKIFTSIVFLTLSLFINSLLAQDTLVKWTFPAGALTDTVQNGTNSLNLTRWITTNGGTSVMSMTNGQVTGDYAVTASDWDNGSDLKNWNIEFKTTGYTNIKLSSKQRAGNNPKGPKDWKAQYRVGSSGTWTDIPTASITLANDWTTGVLNAVLLPTECDDNVSSIYVRWIMTSNLDIAGVTVTSTATSKIDDIIVTGTSVSGIESNSFENLVQIYPNPNSGSFTFKNISDVKTIRIFNTVGKCVYETETFIDNRVNVSDIDKGLYFIQFTTLKNKQYSSKINFE